MRSLRLDDINRLMREILDICLGVQLMRNAGIFQVYEGVESGILWPLSKVGKYVETLEMRRWVLDFMDSWPRESIIVLLDLNSH